MKGDGPSRRLRVLQALMLVLGVVSLVVSSRLRLSGDLTDLFPKGPEAEALATFTRAFGGGDVGLVLVRGDDPASVTAATEDASRRLEGRATVERVVASVPQPKPPDPSLAWLHAGPGARAALAYALTPAGMRRRLEGTRSLLLAPAGSPETSEALRRDPLRLSALPWEGRSELAAGVTADGEGRFVADGGRARLVVLEPKGRVFDPEAAETFVREVEGELGEVRRAHPGVRLELTGGHAVAYATERMIRTDLYLSTALSFVLSAVMFLVTFRRARALLAVLPPLMLGTVWTTAIAALVYPRLSSLSVAFTSVVVGVGVDTGVHVYGALLDARAKGHSPEAAAEIARRTSARPTLTAAVVAGLAFGALGISDIAALGQLGVLCAVGEVLTAIAILLFAPDVGRWLERGTPAARAPAAWVRGVSRLTRGRGRAWAALAVLPALVGALVLMGLPRTGDAVVALRPSALAPLRTSDAIYGLFGGRPNQWIVLVHDRDLDRATAEIDAVAEALEPLVADGTIDGFDAMTTYIPSRLTQRARLLERDGLDLPAKARLLRETLDAVGFDADAFAEASASLEHPKTETLGIPLEGRGPLSLVVSRHVQLYKGEHYVAAYVRPTGDPAKDLRLRETLRGASPRAVVTGFAALELSLRRTLVHDLPRIALLASVFVGVALGFTLRSVRSVALALLALATEIAMVGVAMRVLNIRWHVYDALVLPVLLGITLDEVLFLLHAADERSRSRDGSEGTADPIDAALDKQAPLSAATALTTAAGFGALVACRFEGLFDLGAVGAIGSVAGLVASLVVVPAGLRLLAPTPPAASPTPVLPREQPPEIP
ncbi:MAG TPA: MMPL family transporter [Polyangiaceae bacterium]|nr:MMPL family transporter [Polyangiaceae bacterium]